MNRETATATGIGVIVGFLIGTTVTLLYAPKSGAETREIIKGKAAELKDKALVIKNKAGNLIKGNKEES